MISHYFHIIFLLTWIFHKIFIFGLCTTLFWKCVRSMMVYYYLGNLYRNHKTNFYIIFFCSKTVFISTRFLGSCTMQLRNYRSVIQNDLRVCNSDHTWCISRKSVDDIHRYDDANWNFIFTTLSSPKNTNKGFHSKVYTAPFYLCNERIIANGSQKRKTNKATILDRRNGCNSAILTFYLAWNLEYMSCVVVLVIKSPC